MSSLTDAQDYKEHSQTIITFTLCLKNAIRQYSYIKYDHYDMITLTVWLKSK